MEFLLYIVLYFIDIYPGFKWIESGQSKLAFLIVSWD